MNVNDLNAEMARHGLSIPKLATIMGVSKKRLYSRFKKETAFNQEEIQTISKILNLGNEKILEIFFTDLVS